MNRERLFKLLEVYSLEEIFIDLDLEAIDVLVILEEQGYISELELPEPL